MSRLQLIRIGAGIAGTGAATALLWCFPPASSSFYPVCPFHQWTGLLCPGCGGTRALAALLHGSLAEAWGNNALLVLLLPVIFSYVALGCFRQLRGGQAGWPRVSQGQVAALLVAAVGFALWRNQG